ncbi:HPr family phosphocarrier protein [Mediterraneibacter glycyrrhizinilyticus]|nr:HPr family phosphocarrier protein [Mediterraneibacter glycyrrhizinilyticus]
MSIQFKDYETVERFSKDIANMKGEFDLVSGRKVVDAKSFLGIFSLDLSAPLTLNAVTDDAQALAVFQRYVV